MRATLDHITPLSRGGSHIFENTMAAHWLCNNVKSDRIIGVDVSRDQLIAEIYCAVEDCKKPRHQGQQMCGSHYMKKYRYGDPLYKAPPKYEDLTGRRFGVLTVVRRVGIKWECLCDCGSVALVRPGDLNRSSVKSCGNSAKHRRSDNISYSGMHARLRADRGNASDHACVSCGNKAKHWAYNHTDPDEIQGEKGPFSLNINNYDPMCVSCHKNFDLARLTLGDAASTM